MNARPGSIPVDDPDQTVEFVVSHLPAEFHGASCWWQFTASQGFASGIRIRLFFWSDRPLADWELKQWLGELVPDATLPRKLWKKKYPVDPAIFAPAQPIYVAAPFLMAWPTRCRFARGVWRGDPRRDHAAGYRKGTSAGAATRKPFISGWRCRVRLSP